MAIIALVVLLIIASKFGSSVKATKAVDRSDACSMSQDFVKDNLKAPTTAQFPMWTQDNCKTSQSGNHWTVYSFVDSQNGFGAQIRSEYVAEMTYNASTERWTLDNLAMSSR